MKKTRLLKMIFKQTGAFRLLVGYVIIFAAVSVGIWIVEPHIDTLFYSVWYSFSVATTIGFGDITAVTFLGRAMSIFLSLCSVLIIAVVPGIITSFFIENTKIKANESTAKFIDDLERLPELSKEELTQLSERVKKYHRKSKSALTVNALCTLAAKDLSCFLL